jgi:hypothetical protein
MAKCTCKKSGNKHASDCPRNPARLKVEARAQQKQNKKNKTVKNARKYAGMDADTSRAYADEGGQVRGHGSRNSNFGTHGNTRQDVAGLRKFAASRQ